MSRIKELKSENIIDLVGLFSYFVPEKKSKYVELLIRLLKKTKNIDQHKKEVVERLVNEFNIDKKEIEKEQTLHLVLFYNIVEAMFNFQDLKSFQRFCEYNERSLIKQNDLSRYNDFEEIMSELSVADLIVDQKKLEKQTICLMDTDEWLIVRPLTYLSSKKYGSNTKWCTTQENNSEYFTKYSSKGVLIYCINKKTGYKVACFYSLDKGDPEFSFWNQKDTRIDSLQTEITDEVRDVIIKVIKDKNVKTNRFLLGDDERIKEESIIKSLVNVGELPERLINTDQARRNYIRRNLENLIDEENTNETIPQSELPMDPFETETRTFEQ
jgi:hypothetical protein